MIDNGGQTPSPHGVSGRDRVALQRLFILVLALAVSAVFLWMIRSYLDALFLAAVLTLFLMPVQRLFTRLLGGRRIVAAASVLVIATVIIVLPLLAILAIVAEQAVDVVNLATPWVQEQVRAFREGGISALPEWIPFRDAIAPYQAEIASQLGNLVSSAGRLTVDALTRATGSTLGLFLNLVVLLFALFYFLTHGERVAHGGLDLMPLPPSERALLARRTLSTVRATVKGTFVIALIQGVLTGGALAVAGVPGAAFWGTIAGLLSIIPGIGPPLVWGPAALWLGLSGQLLEGVLLAVWGAVVVGLIDNLLRPMLVGKDAKLPDLMVLLSTLGGLALFGPIGLVLGPVIASLFSAVWYLYAQSYGPLLAEASHEAEAVGSGGDPPEKS